MEANFDGLVAPHASLRGGRLVMKPSTRYRFQVSNPRLAAKQGLTENESPCRCGIPPAAVIAAPASVYSGAASVGI
ncbi:hypothetical protein ACLK1T_25845 [Escherichia coli]